MAFLSDLINPVTAGLPVSLLRRQSQNAPSPQQPPALSPAEQAEVQALYRQNLNRDAGPDDFYTHRGNTVAGIEQAILASPEYQARPAGASTGYTPTGTAAPPLPDGYGGQGLAWGGFDMQRAQSPGTSAKDTMLHYGSLATWMPKTKAEAEQWWNEFIAPGMAAQGYKVHWVKGDKAFVSTRENPGGEEIDFLVNAGGNNPQLAWQSSLADLASPTAPFPTTTVPTTTTTTTGLQQDTTPPASSDQTPSEAPPEPTPDTSATQAPTAPASPDAVNQFASSLVAAGGDVVEVKGDRMRIVTAEDRAQGNLQGRWIIIGRAMRKNRSLADLAERY